MASTAPMTRESIPSPEYARLEERIVARDQKGASDVLYGLFKQHRPAIEILRETVRIHAPFTHVPYHQRLDDGIVKFVNNDHCLLSERVGLPLMSMVRPELAWLPLAQTVWYMPTGLDPWNQLLGKAPGHYTRLYEIAVHQEPPTPEIHWPDQEPLRTDGPIGERLNHWLTLVQRGEVLPSYRVFLGLMEDVPHRREALAHLAFAGLIDVQDRMLHNRSYTTGHKSYRARATIDLGNAIGWEHAHSVLYAGVPDIAVGPRWYSTYEMGGNVVQSLLDARDAELLKQTAALTPAEEAMLVEVITRGREINVIEAIVALLQSGAAADPRRDPGRRRAGDSRDRRREQLLDVTARLRVLQHARLVLRHVPAPAPAQAPLRRRLLHSARGRAPAGHAEQPRSTHAHATARRLGAVGDSTPRQAGSGVARARGRRVGRAHRGLPRLRTRSRAAGPDARVRRRRGRQRSAQPGARAVIARGLREDACARPRPTVAGAGQTHRRSP